MQLLYSCSFTDVIISGTVTIHDGLLSVDDLIDTRYNISSRKLIDFGIPLDASVIDMPITFHAGFKVKQTCHGSNFSTSCYNIRFYCSKLDNY